MSLLERLNQTETWMDKEGTVHKIEDMELSHKKNCIDWLDRNAPSLLTQYRTVLTRANNLMPTKFLGSHLQAMQSVRADFWIQSRPLYKTIAAFIEEDERKAAEEPSWSELRAGLRSRLRDFRNNGKMLIGNYNGSPAIERIVELNLLWSAVGEQIQIMYDKRMKEGRENVTVNIADREWSHFDFLDPEERYGY